ncbi:hypothetical protein P5673_015133 [Acropora cervicornis]|uniref:Uncharacterized protein n=1 Tax=Acropora cervicornis TaxID=6130 RepID=A0AAD9V591_ACRCE|nr:hypothetical protein P5673_015133 [Acropora cervicornis]
MHSLTLSYPSSSPIPSHPPSAPSSPSILVDTMGASSTRTLSVPPRQNSTNFKSVITPCIGHRGYVNVLEKSFTPVDIFKPVTVTSKRKHKAKKPVYL